MKLSEIRGEAAIELLADILEPAAIIMADPEVEKVIKADKPKIIIASTLLKNHPKEILKILALLNQEDLETYKPSLLVLPKMVIDLLNDEELMNLFHSQSQLKEDESSASVSENIAE